MTVITAPYSKEETLKDWTAFPLGSHAGPESTSWCKKKK